MASPLRADVLLMEGMQFLDEYPQLRAKFPPGKFQIARKRGVRIDPSALPDEERTVWNVVDYSPDPYRVFRKACLSWYEGLRALWGLWDRGLVVITSYSIHYTKLYDFVDIRVVEIKRGRLLWKEDGLTDAASYFVGPDFQYTESNRRMAFEEICRRLARRIGETLREIL